MTEHLHATTQPSGCRQVSTKISAGVGRCAAKFLAAVCRGYENCWQRLASGILEMPSGGSPHLRHTLDRDALEGKGPQRWP